MATVISQGDVASETIAPGLTRQRLLTSERIRRTRVLVDHLQLSPGATLPIEVSPKSLAWFQLIKGGSTLRAPYTDHLSANHSVFLSSGFKAKVIADKDVSLLYAEIPDVAPVNPKDLDRSPHFMVIDWTRERVFNSEHDERKRIQLVTADICDTTAIKIEMVIYPVGNMSPTHYHEGADTFMFILTGRATATAKEGTFAVRPGDLIYYPEGERHSLRATGDDDLRFLEVHLPGEFSTVWADPAKASAWLSTDRDINGEETGRDQREREAFKHMLGMNFWVR